MIISQTRLLKRTVETMAGKVVLCYFPMNDSDTIAREVMFANYPDRADEIWEYPNNFVMLTFGNINELCADDYKNAKSVGL